MSESVPNQLRSLTMAIGLMSNWCVFSSGYTSITELGLGYSTLRLLKSRLFLSKKSGGGHTCKCSYVYLLLFNEHISPDSSHVQL